MNEDFLVAAERAQAKAEAEPKQRDAYSRRVADVSRFLPAPRGLFVKRCPLCNSRLVKRPWFSPFRGFDVGSHYTCPSCPYQYAAWFARHSGL